MATSKSTTHPSAAQDRAITTTAPTAHGGFRFTNRNLGVLYDIYCSDGMEPKGSPSELRLIQKLQAAGLVELERVNRWKLTSTGETLMQAYKRAAIELELMEIIKTNTNFSDWDEAAQTIGLKHGVNPDLYEWSEANRSFQLKGQVVPT